MIRLPNTLRHLVAGGLISVGLVAGACEALAQNGTIPVPPPPLPAASMFKPPIAADLPTTSGLQPEPIGSPRTINNADRPGQATIGSEQPYQDCDPRFDFSKVPNVRATPRPGYFAVPPKGPGYYSLLDVIQGNYREGPPRFPYPPLPFFAGSFFDADFRYLDNPENTQHDPLDVLKRIKIGDNWMFSTGGEFRTREMIERNSRLTRTDNDYDLNRVRTYGDLWYKDQLRVYAEFIGAWSTPQELVPLVTDRTRADLQNLFADVKLFDFDDSPVYARLGRQELLFGSQRLVAPLDWANTRRTFDGARFFRQTENFDVDVFWARPVVPNDLGRLSSSDRNQNFAGVFSTYRPNKNEVLDFYYLFLDNANHTVQTGIKTAPYNVHTIGSRYAGNNNNFLWDAEGSVQLGERGQQNIIAGKADVGVGYNFACLPFNQTFWIYYDYASGSHNPTGHTDSTYNQLFPFNHYYSGWIDLVGPQNLHDLNLQYYIYPAKWVTLWTQWHNFWLDSASDALYNKAGNAFRRSATGTAGTYVGNELDFISTFHLTAHSDLMASYAYFFGGDFLRNTASKTAGVNSSTLSLMYTFRW